MPSIYRPLATRTWADIPALFEGDTTRSWSDVKHALRRVLAIGLDTNAFGSKHLSLERLRDLVRRAKKHGSLEVWIPESVLWEWAEHAAAEHKTRRRRARATAQSRAHDVAASSQNGRQSA